MTPSTKPPVSMASISSKLRISKLSTSPTSVPCTRSASGRGIAFPALELIKCRHRRTNFAISFFLLSHGQYGPRRWVEALTPRCPVTCVCVYAYTTLIALAAHVLPQEPYSGFNLPVRLTSANYSYWFFGSRYKSQSWGPKDPALSLQEAQLPLPALLPLSNVNSASFQLKPTLKPVSRVSRVFPEKTLSLGLEATTKFYSVPKNN